MGFLDDDDCVEPVAEVTKSDLDYDAVLIRALFVLGSGEERQGFLMVGLVDSTVYGIAISTLGDHPRFAELSLVLPLPKESLRQRFGARPG
jgi:hypothetical protein